MSDDTELKDADDIYTNTMNEIFDKFDVNLEKYTREEIHELAKLGTSQFSRCYDELMLWVLYGDNKRLFTRHLLKLAIKYGSR